MFFFHRKAFLFTERSPAVKNTILNFSVYSNSYEKGLLLVISKSLYLKSVHFLELTQLCVGPLSFPREGVGHGLQALNTN